MKTKLTKFGKVDEYSYKKYFHFLGERMKIFNNRFIKLNDSPWTDDEVFKKYKFCNIHRFLDRNTLFFHNHVYNKCSSEKEIFANVVFCRFYNKLETAKLIGYVDISKDTFEEVSRIADIIENIEGAVFTSAHLVSSMPKTDPFDNRRDGKSNRFLHVYSMFLDNLDEHFENLKDKESIEECWEYLSSGMVKGIGGFVGMEIVYELHYTKVLNNIKLDWCNPGPGCVRGINSIMTFEGIEKSEYRKVYQEIINIMKEEAPDVLEELGFDVNETLHIQVHGITVPNDLMIYENIFCELSKYLKVDLKLKGRPRHSVSYARTPTEEGTKRRKSYLELLDLSNFKIGEHDVY